jgi:hypothetical protein
MERPLPPTVRRLLAAGAVFAAIAAGCGGGDEALRPAKAPPPPPKPVPSATAVASAPDPAPQPSAQPEAPAAPSAAEIEAALFAISSDPPPPKITLDTHYVISNEDRPYVFHDAVAGRGGVYVGVGAEQSYLLGGWSRADLLFLMDFDEWVVDINEVHGLVFTHARVPADVVDLWGYDHVSEVKAWIAESAPDRATAERRTRVFEHERLRVEGRLKWMKTRFTVLEKPFFGNDQAELDHVARLWKNRRVRCVRGDLTMNGALRSFGALARRAGWVVRTLYMSNAELYFSYDKEGFRDNIRALPFDERSVVLHTHPASSQEYFYFWQDAQGFVPWMGRVESFRALLLEAKLPGLGKLDPGVWQLNPRQ